MFASPTLEEGSNSSSKGGGRRDDPIDLTLDDDDSVELAPPSNETLPLTIAVKEEPKDFSPEQLDPTTYPGIKPPGLEDEQVKELHSLETSTNNQTLGQPQQEVQHDATYLPIPPAPTADSEPESGEQDIPVEERMDSENEVPRGVAAPSLENTIINNQVPRERSPDESQVSPEQDQALSQRHPGGENQVSTEQQPSSSQTETDTAPAEDFATNMLSVLNTYFSNSTQLEEIDRLRIEERTQHRSQDQTAHIGNEEPVNPDDEEADGIASATFQEMKKNFEARKKQGTITDEEEIEFRRAEDAEQRRQRVLERKRAFEPEIADDQRMFFSEPEEGGATIRPTPLYAEASQRSVKKQKRPSKASATSQSWTISDDDLPRPKQRAKPRKPRDPQKTVQGPKTRVTKPKSLKEKKIRAEVNKIDKKRGRRQRTPDMANVSSLWHNDIVGDARANAGREAQPGFTSKNKKTALQELVSSIPSDHRDLYNADKKDLDNACKKFGYKGQGSMGADGQGGWRLKGMHTSLYHYQLLGAGKMRDRENGKNAPYGGLLADSMGFGKTVACITNILGK